MLTRRLFQGCALCAATGLLALPAAAQTQAAAGITRRLIGRTDVPGGQFEAIQAATTVDPGFFVPRHTHPGIESTFVQSGGGTLIVAGRPDTAVKPGDSFLIPVAVPHAFRNDAAPTILSSTYVVDKSKPLASPAPE